jgi:hypothetical protein
MILLDTNIVVAFLKERLQTLIFLPVPEIFHNPCKPQE